MDSAESVTTLLQQWGNGDKRALDRLMPVIYDQLRGMAGKCLQSERFDHTLPATALVHEAYLKLVDSDLPWQNRAQFYAVASQVLRNVLVDYARARGSQKRWGEAQRVSLDDVILVSPESCSSVLELDEALRRLSEQDARKGRIVEFFFLAASPTKKPPQRFRFLRPPFIANCGWHEPGFIAN
jgi:RNA polymerase sigma factor (TIGR02999 family)